MKASLKCLLRPVLVAATIFCFLATAYAENNNTVIKIGFYPMAGLQNVNNAGTLSGYTYDYLQEISKITGWEYQYYVVDFASCLSMLQSGEIDIMGGMQITEERKKDFDFPAYSCGELCVELLVKGGNTKYAYEDTASFNGMNVGVIKGLAGNNDLTQYCSDNNFTIHIKEYGGVSDVLLALEKGEVEAFSTLNTLPRENLRCIATFGYKNFYFMTSKKKPQLVRELNFAMEKIKTLNPLYEQELKLRYLPTQKNFSPVFTKEEIAYIKKAKTLKVLYNTNLKPLDYYNKETDSFEGIIADIFELIAKLSGLQFQYIPVESHLDSYKMLANHQADIKSSAPNDYAWAAKNNIKISHEYLSVPAVMLSGKRKNHDQTIVAMPKRLHISKRIQDGLPNYTYKTFNSYEECFEAIYKGEADATFANTYQASELLKNTKFSNLNVLAMNGYFTTYCMAFADNVDKELLTIIDKTLACISKDQINEIIIAHTMNYLPVTLIDLIYQHPVRSILIISSIFGAFIILVLTLINKIRFARTLYNIVNVDKLTGEASYAKFCKDTEILLNSPKRAPNYAVMYINIAKFKDINDLYGYNIGDQVLKATSNYFKKNLAPGELFTRTYADHFVILFMCDKPVDLKTRYLQFLNRIAASLADQGLPCKLRFMAGVYFLTETDKDIVACTDRAKYAHSQSESDMSQLYVLYDDALKQKIQYELILESQMEDALAGGEFAVFYQPKVNSISGEAVGAEALVRWKNTKYGMLSPAVFIPLFERNTFILKLDYFVFQEVCKFISELQLAEKPVFPISCNFSRLHFLDESFSDKLTDITNRFKVDRSLLNLEITESIAIKDINAVKLQFNKLRENGFAISIDDFGSGYSSLGILSEIEFDEIKLDRSIIMNALVSDSNKLLLNGVVSMIQSLKKSIVCEGVEDLAQVELLQSMGCHTIQGYYYSKPLPEQEFINYLNSF